MQPTKWEIENKGKAQKAFAQAQSTQTTAASQVQTGSGSEMVRKTQPVMAGPKPPGIARSSASRQVHTEKLAAEGQKARAAQNLTREEKIARLNERFKKARDKDLEP